MQNNLSGSGLATDDVSSSDVWRRALADAVANNGKCFVSSIGLPALLANWISSLGGDSVLLELLANTLSSGGRYSRLMDSVDSGIPEAENIKSVLKSAGDIQRAMADKQFGNAAKFLRSVLDNIPVTDYSEKLYTVVDALQAIDKALGLSVNGDYQHALILLTSAVQKSPFDEASYIYLAAIMNVLDHLQMLTQEMEQRPLVLAESLLLVPDMGRLLIEHPDLIAQLSLHGKFTSVAIASYQHLHNKDFLHSLTMIVQAIHVLSGYSEHCSRYLVSLQETSSLKAAAYTNQTYEQFLIYADYPEKPWIFKHVTLLLGLYQFGHFMQQADVGLAEQQLSQLQASSLFSSEQRVLLSRLSLALAAQKEMKQGMDDLGADAYLRQLWQSLGSVNKPSSPM